VGRHLAEEEPPPPKDKPRYRFLVAISGIIVLACAAMAVVNWVFPEKGPQATAGPDTTVDGNPFPVVPGDPGWTADPSVSPTTAPDATSPGSTPTAPPPAVAPGAVTGAYAVQSTYPATGFQAQVSLTNTSAGPQPWQVRILYPDNVTGYVAVWIDSYANQPQPPSVDGGYYVFTGSSPLHGGETVALRFHMTASGGDITPSECWVNERPCT
jgi:hypothetical protein